MQAGQVHSTNSIQGNNGNNGFSHKFKLERSPTPMSMFIQQGQRLVTKVSSSPNMKSNQMQQQQQQQFGNSGFIAPERKQSHPFPQIPQNRDSIDNGMENAITPGKDDLNGGDVGFALGGSCTPTNDQMGEEMDAERSEEEQIIQQIITDPILIKNTSFNASFIQVPETKGLKKMSSKKIMFAEKREEIFDDGKTITSSAKVEDDRMSILSIGDSDSDTDRKTGKSKMSQELEFRPSFQSRGSSLYAATGSKGLNNKSKLNQVTNANSMTPNHNGLQRPKSFDQAPTFLSNPSMQSMSPSMFTHSAKMTSSPKNAAMQCSVTQKLFLDQHAQTETDLVQDDLFQINADLLEYISNLEQQLSQQQEESRAQLQLNQGQKEEFQKLSAQMYQKMKDLVTEKTIMAIEIKSLRQQIDKVIDHECEFNM